MGVGRTGDRLWYLLPVFWGPLGGGIAYLLLRGGDPQRARRCLAVALIAVFASAPAGLLLMGPGAAAGLGVAGLPGMLAGVLLAESPDTIKAGEMGEAEEGRDEALAEAEEAWDVAWTAYHAALDDAKEAWEKALEEHHSDERVVELRDAHDKAKESGVPQNVLNEYSFAQAKIWQAAQKAMWEEWREALENRHSNLEEAQKAYQRAVEEAEAEYQKASKTP